MKTLLKILNITLATFVVVSAFFILGALLPIESSYTLRVIESGSMEPAIPVGGMVATIPRAEYRVGDTITFYGSGRDTTPTTHRIISVEESSEGEQVFRTKGDANPQPDISQVGEEQVLGKVFLIVPYVGYVAYLMQTTLGVGIALGAFVLWLVLTELVPRMRKRSDKSQNNDKF